MILPYKSRNIRRALALILMILLTALNLSAAAESVVTTKKARAYRSPSDTSASISIPAGTVLQQTAEKSGWIRVKRAGVTAYMRASDVEPVVNCNSATGYTTKAVSMYKAYGKTAKYGTIPANAAVKVYALIGDWACVNYRKHRGFIEKSALTTEKPAAESTPATDPEVTITKGKSAYVASNGAKVYKSWSTSSKVLGKLDMNTKLSVSATRGDWALVGKSGHYCYMLLSDLSEEKVTTAKPETPKAETPTNSIQAKDWFTSDIQTIFARGVTATITDVATGISWQEVRKGGSSHADCQPLTAQDTANLKKACGGWSWNRRAVIVTINGQHYAASINSMPHGGGSISGNNFDGHHCVHFVNSKTHGSNKVDPDHQAAIKKALALNSK